MSFIAFALIVAISCFIISAKTLVGYGNISWFVKLPVIFILLLGWFTPIWTNMLRRFNLLDGELFSLTYLGGYCLFGFVFILFSVLLFRDIAWYIIYIFDRNFISPKNIQALNIANITAVLLSLVVTLYTIYAGTKTPELKEVNIKTPKISKDFSIAFISDLHIDRVSSIDKIKKIVEITNAQKPDVIALGGDIIDDYWGMDSRLKELAKLKAKYGVYVVLGNHEVYRGYAQSKNRLERIGFKFLLNNGEKLGDNIYIGGTPDYTTATYYKELNIDLKKTLKDSSDNDYKVLLSHSPKYIDALKNNEIDLQLSGHTHGGQIFPFHFMVKYANHYLAGLYDVNKMKIYVSRGAGTWGPPMRLFAPSEITLIKLIKE